MKWISILILSLALCVAHGAVSFEWNSDEGATNRLSDGVTPMDDSFEFVIGNFTTGFDPGTRSRAEWVENFQVVGTTTYLEGSMRFLAASILNSNASPFGLAEDVYIWGRNGTESGSEWILVNSSSWSWPDANPIGPPIPQTLRMATATNGEALVGSVNMSGIHMQTEKVVFELSYSDWAAEEFDPGEASAPTDDPDGDGNDNFFEYAVGADPKKKDAGQHVSMNAAREIRIQRPQGRQAVWSLEGSDDLTNFTAMVSGFELVSDGEDELVFRITEALAARRFYRAVAAAE